MSTKTSHSAYRSMVHASECRPLTVSVIGAGRLGTALGRALAACSFQVETVVTRTAFTARRAANLIHPRPRFLTPSRLHLLPPSDILLITTPDDAIEATAARLASVIQKKPRQRVALHSSGALASSVLESLRTCNFAVGSVHPLISVSDGRSGAESLPGAFYCIEGDAQAVRIARQLVRALEGHSFTIKTGDKALYHAAAVMTSGHAVALFHIAVQLLARCGLSESRARRVLLPLLESTHQNLTKHLPEKALTGTFARGDLCTVERHLTALDAQHIPGALAAYVLLGQHSLHLAAKSGMDQATRRRIKSTLEKVTGRSVGT